MILIQMGAFQKTMLWLSVALPTVFECLAISPWGRGLSICLKNNCFCLLWPVSLGYGIALEKCVFCWWYQMLYQQWWQMPRPSLFFYFLWINCQKCSYMMPKNSRSAAHFTSTDYQNDIALLKWNRCVKKRAICSQFR